MESKLATCIKNLKKKSKLFDQVIPLLETHHKEVI